MDDYGQRLTLLVTEKIREQRTAHGLSLDELGRRTGLHPTSIGLVVRGKRGLTLASAATLCDALGLSLGDVVKAAEVVLRGRRDID